MGNITRKNSTQMKYEKQQNNKLRNFCQQSRILQSNNSTLHKKYYTKITDKQKVNSSQ